MDKFTMSKDDVNVKDVKDCKDNIKDFKEFKDLGCKFNAYYSTKIQVAGNKEEKSEIFIFKK